MNLNEGPNQGMDQGLEDALERALERALDKALGKALESNPGQGRDQDQALDRALNHALDKVMEVLDCGSGVEPELKLPMKPDKSLNPAKSSRFGRRSVKAKGRPEIPDGNVQRSGW